MHAIKTTEHRLPLVFLAFLAITLTLLAGNCLSKGNPLAVTTANAGGGHPGVDDDLDNFSENQGDCNDSDPTINPDADEIPVDGVDQDCDEMEVCYQDLDNDAYGTETELKDSDLTCNSPGLASRDGDCDDDNPSRHPDATEVPVDGIDQDCDGGEACYQDLDDDAWGTPILVPSANMICFDDPGEAPITGDCNDGDPSIHPSAEEVPGDEVDQNCDGVEICHDDADGDGYGAGTVMSDDLDCSDPGEGAIGGDCDEDDPAIHPGIPEIVGDGTDQDCSGSDDCYEDSDLDGFGSTTLVGTADLDCTDAGESGTSADCNDIDHHINPGATEIADNGIDDDCDPGTPDSTATGSPTATPTGTPVATPTETPSGTIQPTAPAARIWGDNNCSGGLDTDDFMLALLYFAGLADEVEDCLDMEQEIEVDDFERSWGDVDCSGDVDEMDALLWLLEAALLDVTLEPDCPTIGESVVVT